jgi:hypothetical protein
MAQIRVTKDTNAELIIQDMSRETLKERRAREKYNKFYGLYEEGPSLAKTPQKIRPYTVINEF